VLICLDLVPPVLANPVTTEHVTARLVAERTEITPGSQVDLALVLEIRPGWHTYWRNPGDSGEAPRLDWSLPYGVGVGPIQWPTPEVIPVGPLANYGYSGRAVHLVRLSLPRDWPVGEPVQISAEAHWLVCETHCVPESATLALTLATASDPGPIALAEAEVFATARAALPLGSLDGAVLRDSGTAFQLEIPMRGLAGTWAEGGGADLQGAWFFAAEWGLIEHAAAQPWRLHRGVLQVDLTPGVRAAAARPEGLLVVADASGGTHAFEIAATRVSGPLQASVERPLSLATAFAFALLGGLILNLMPCVFPILAMKALSLVHGLGAQGPGAWRGRAGHGLSYTAGVLVFFAGLALLLLGLRAAGAAVGWGFQLQYPPFVAVMAFLFFVIGVSLTGGVTLGAGLMGVGDGAPRGGALGAFATGALAALVAAPCTAPFMGAALGYAVTLPWPLALAIVLTLGLGLALPFLLLSLIPRLAHLLPRPGPWMGTLRQALAFPMFAASAWLIWVLSVQTGSSGVAAGLAGLVLLGVALWLNERTRGLGRVARRWGVAGALMASAIALFLASTTERLISPAGVVSADAGVSSVAYSPARLVEARAEGRPVFVNMTAAWCITCLVNERVALSSDAIARGFEVAGVVYIKGDWTNRDPLITQYLAGYGRNGVPLYVVYPPDGEPRVLPQILTEDLVLEAVQGLRRAPQRSAQSFGPEGASAGQTGSE
jgi:thiol:disulfide interchange protein DsbD